MCAVNRPKSVESGVASGGGSLTGSLLAPPCGRGLQRASWEPLPLDPVGVLRQNFYHSLGKGQTPVSSPVSYFWALLA